LDTYRWWLDRFGVGVPDVNPITVRGFFARLQERGLSASRQHQAYRTLKTFLRWCVETRVLTENPLQGFSMRKPKTLPNVPTEDELRAVVAVCTETLEGGR
jgi:site-specific recombinase XerD